MQEPLVDAMRTVVELPPEQIDGLEELSARTALSPEELIRRAIAEYLARHRPPFDEGAFGLWRARAVGARVIEDQLREDWKP